MTDIIHQLKNLLSESRYRLDFEKQIVSKRPDDKIEKIKRETSYGVSTGLNFSIKQFDDFCVPCIQ